VLVIVTIPRLIISFASTCVKSVRHPWLFIGGYFISYIPPLLLFVIFVLPSELYQKKFNDATVRIRKIIRNRFGLQ
ncbi:unnamed protein product, partial [Rotaria sp. Silwood2]